MQVRYGVVFGIRIVCASFAASSRILAAAVATFVIAVGRSSSPHYNLVAAACYHVHD